MIIFIPFYITPFRNVADRMSGKFSQTGNEKNLRNRKTSPDSGRFGSQQPIWHSPNFPIFQLNSENIPVKTFSKLLLWPGIQRPRPTPSIGALDFLHKIIPAIDFTNLSLFNIRFRGIFSDANFLSPVYKKDSRRRDFTFLFLGFSC